MRLFFTETTPVIDAASRSAEAFCAAVFTKPLSCTTPFMVSTLTANDFTASSARSALLIFVVMTVSSTYSPVLSLVRVEAQAVKKGPHASAAVRARSAASLVAVGVFMSGGRFVFLVMTGIVGGQDRLNDSLRLWGLVRLVAHRAAPDARGGLCPILAAERQL